MQREKEYEDMIEEAQKAEEALRVARQKTTEFIRKKVKELNTIEELREFQDTLAVRFGDQTAIFDKINLLEEKRREQKIPIEEMFYLLLSCFKVELIAGQKTVVFKMAGLNRLTDKELKDLQIYLGN
jgi:hypothetical protein